MVWLYVSVFFGGAFLTNAIPHFVNGLSGRKFPSPFAKPPGKGESSAVINVLWGAFNVAVAYVLLFQVTHFVIYALDEFLVAGLGGLVMALLLAWNFGKVYGG